MSLPPLRAVAPFKPFPPESDLHRAVADQFDWIEALRMLGASVAQSAPFCSFQALTDLTTQLPVPVLRYDLHETRLMLWLLEACVAYLRSDAFDRDTVMLDVDQLVVKPLAPHFPNADLGVLVRQTKRPQDMALLNGVQFWRVRAKDRLAGFYQQVLDTARAMSDDVIRWGADGNALVECLKPLGNGADFGMRHGLKVAFIKAPTVLEEWSTMHMAELENGKLLGPSRPVYDFRYKRKVWMPRVFEMWQQQRQAVPA